MKYYVQRQQNLIVHIFESGLSFTLTDRYTDIAIHGITLVAGKLRYQ